MFARWSTTDSVGSKDGWQINTQLAGSAGSYVDGMKALMQNAERWRLAYAGVTIYQDGASLSDNGTVAAAIVPTRFVEPGGYIATGMPTGYLPSLNKLRTLSLEDLPTFDGLCKMPNAYFSQSKMGVYMPLKLSSDHLRWRGATDVFTDISGLSLTSPSSTVLGVPASNPAGDVMTGIASVPYGTASVISYAGYPYGSVTGTTTALTCPWFNSTAGTGFPMIGMAQRLEPLNENWGQAVFQNMAVTTRLVCYFRFGLEIQATPTSTYSPYLHVPVQSDEEALRSYFAIARELKDAYPSDYNDLGKLLGEIGRAAKAAFPLPATIAIAAGRGIGKLAKYLDGVREESKAVKATIPTATDPDHATRAPPDKPPALEVERARERAAIADIVERTGRTSFSPLKKTSTKKKKPLSGNARAQQILLNMARRRRN
jgi:hypothetical protein